MLSAILNFLQKLYQSISSPRELTWEEKGDAHLAAGRVREAIM